MRNRFRRAGVVTLVLAGAFGGAAAASAQNDAGAHAVAPLAEQYCFRCHGPQTQTAGINLATLVTERPLVRNRETGRFLEHAEPTDLARILLQGMGVPIEKFGTADGPLEGLAG